MSHSTNAGKLNSTTFIGREIREVVYEVANWMDSYTVSSKRINSFYFLEMTQGYDGEIGFIITVYHGAE